MILRSLQISEDEFQFLTGFRPTPGILIAFSSLLSFLGLLGGGGDSSTIPIVYGNPAVAILIGMAVAGITTGIAGGVAAGKAAKEAAKKTGAERTLEQEAALIETGVDRAEVEGMIAAGATPIGGALASQQQAIAQEGVVAEGGAGLPGSTQAGRTAALQQNLARESSEGLAQMALGAQQQGEESALGRHQLKASMLGGAAEMARTRKGQEAAARSAQAQALMGISGQAVGGVSSGATTAALS